MKRRDAVTMTDDEITQYLADQEAKGLILGTIRPDGRPHLTAMGYRFIDGQIVMMSFAKAQKVQNLRRDNRCSCITDSRGSYHDLRGVEVVGSAEITDDHDSIVAFIEHLRATLPADRQFPDATTEKMANNRALLRITADRYVSWDHNKLGGTY